MRNGTLTGTETKAMLAEVFETEKASREMISEAAEAAEAAETEGEATEGIEGTEGGEEELDEESQLYQSLHQLQNVQTDLDAAIDAAMQGVISGQGGNAKPIHYKTLLGMFKQMEKTLSDATKRAESYKKGYK